MTITLTTTAFYTAILGGIYIYLSFNVIKNRDKFKAAYEDGNERILKRAIRAHGNFAEYVPLMLLLMIILESLQVHLVLLHSIGTLTVLARLVHAYGLIIAEAKQPPIFKWRVTGMMGTLCALIASVTICAFYSITALF